MQGVPSRASITPERPPKNGYPLFRGGHRQTLRRSAKRHSPSKFICSRVRHRKPVSETHSTFARVQLVTPSEKTDSWTKSPGRGLRRRAAPRGIESSREGRGRFGFVLRVVGRRRLVLLIVVSADSLLGGHTRDSRSRRLPRGVTVGAIQVIQLVPFVARTARCGDDRDHGRWQLEIRKGYCLGWYARHVEGYLEHDHRRNLAGPFAAPFDQ